MKTTCSVFLLLSKFQDAIIKTLKKTRIVRLRANTCKCSFQESTNNILPISPFWMIYSKTNIFETNQLEPKEEPTKARKILRYLKPVKHKDDITVTPRYNSFEKDNSSVSFDKCTSSTKKISKVNENLTTSPRNYSKYRKYPLRKISTLSVSQRLKQRRLFSTEDDEEHESNTNTTNNRKTLTESDVLQMATMSSNSIKKFLGQEAEKFRIANGPQSRRQRAVKKLLAKNSFPELVFRSKTTSAIFKEYQNFKENNGPGFPNNIFRNNHGGLKQLQKVQVDLRNQPFPSTMASNKPVLPSIPT